MLKCIVEKFVHCYVKELGYLRKHSYIGEAFFIFPFADRSFAYAENVGKFFLCQIAFSSFSSDFFDTMFSSVMKKRKTKMNHHKVFLLCKNECIVEKEK